MVRVTVIGVNGNAGSEIASELLRRGHQVTGIARDPSKVKEQKGLTVVKGDVFTDDLAALLKGAEVVVSAYGPGIEVVGPLITLTLRLIKAVAANQRLIVVGGAGGLTMPDGSLTINQSWFPSNIKPIAQAHIDALEILRFYSDAINWTTLSPAGIFFVGERLGHYRTGLENLVANDKGESKISYADYAIALVDEIEKPKHERKRFSVGY